MQPQIIISGVDEADQTPANLPCCQPQVPVLAELLCSEPPTEDLMDSVRENEPVDENSVQSFYDQSLLHHTNVIDSLKFLESTMIKPVNYFSDEKNEILPYMRKVVASWMLEVCEEQRCDEAVFPLAAAILDRFLATCMIKKEQLQLVACVCLLLASKTRQCNHFSLDLLSWYTDNSVSPQALRSWELMILSQLNWDVNVITATDFVDYLLVRLPGARPGQNSKPNALVRRHAITFIALCSTEPRFVSLQPSLVAASAIYTAFKGLKGESRTNSALATELASIVSAKLEELRAVSESIDQVISTEMAAVEQQTAADMTMGKSGAVNLPHSAAGPKLSSYPNCTSGHSHTPTDVQDVIV